MMSLLSVTVKKALFVGAPASQFNTYVTLKLQNVKSTTVTVKGAQPCWEQDFLFETNDLNTGLLIEVWSKGMIWDRAMGYHWIPLQTVQYSNEEGLGQWLSLDAELVMRDGEVVGTKMPTGHSLLVDFRFELPFDPENIEASDLQRKLEMLNNIIDQEARIEQARRQMQYVGHSGYSEDSDYTSDLNYPVGQHPNSSASQFRSVAHQIRTPQRSLETSRENSYERDDSAAQQYPVAAQQQPAAMASNHLSPGTRRRHLPARYSPVNADEYCAYDATAQNSRQYQENSIDLDPLSYNSRPRNRSDFSSQDAWMSCESSFYNQNVDSMDVGYSVDHSYGHSTKKALRRPSLERQTTLYDDFYADPSGTEYYSTVNEVTQVNYVTSTAPFSRAQSEEYYDTLPYPFQEERYGQEEEDRQWDSGGYRNVTTKTGKKLPSIPAVQTHKRRSSFSVVDEGYMGYEDGYRPSIPTPLGRRKMPQIPTRRSSSRQSSLHDDHSCRTPDFTSRGASLPPTPTKSSSKILAKLQPVANKTFNSLPTTPGRQLPKPNPNHRSAKFRRNNRMKRTSSAEYEEQTDYDNYYIRAGAMSARDYNEDYNYAYRSVEDNLPEEDNLTPVPMTTMLPQSVAERTSDNNVFAYFSSLDAYRDVGYFDKPAAIDTAPPQNTDSLESRDDDLKDSSFETVVSSASSSVAYQNKTTSANREEVPEIADRQPNAVPEVLPCVTVAQVHNHNTFRNSNKGTLVHRDPSVDLQPYDSFEYPTKAAIPGRGPLVEQFSEYDEEPYLEAQESIESYMEEDEAIADIPELHTLQQRDSPASVIQVNGYADEEGSLRRGSSQITVVDPYHPSLQRKGSENRRTSETSFTTPTASRKASADAYQSYDEAFSRKPSMVEPSGVQRHGSLRHSPVPQEYRNEIPEENHVGDDLPQVKEEPHYLAEEEEKEQRPQVTAQQRWLWAYNKIIMQLNVSHQNSGLFCKYLEYCSC